MTTHKFLAFDLGATSGRAVIGCLGSEGLTIEEIHRFPNAILSLHNKYYWDIYRLYSELVYSLKLCAKRGIIPQSIGIDTWGVDYGCIGEDGTILGLPRSYRDPYTIGAADEFFTHIPRDTVYQKTGIQVMDFNTLYQMYRAAKEDFSPLKNAHKVLFMPDLLSYMLTGNMVCEYTDASTSQILNPKDKTFDGELLKEVGVSPSLFPDIVMPGTLVGNLSDEVCRQTGLPPIPVVAVAGHDTASAVAAVPSADENFAYLSSGTWSLMGIESSEAIITQESMEENFTNEGGIDATTRFLKNITGMWLLEECMRSWEKEGYTYSYPEIVEMAHSASSFTTLIEPDHKLFTCPEDMPKAINTYCKEKGLKAPSTHAEYVRCIFASLASRYAHVLGVLKRMSPHPIERLHVIGGGCKNALLCQMTADAIGMPVVAGPAEATAIGNIMLQARYAGIVSSRWDMRKAIASGIETITYNPKR